MVQAVDKTLQEGPHTKLPPHLSTLLGLSREQECLVRQGLVQTGKVVQGFDVSTANKNDVVLFVVNETTKDQTPLNPGWHMAACLCGATCLLGVDGPLI